MIKFYCNGKEDFCDERAECPFACPFWDGAGGYYTEDEKPYVDRPKIKKGDIVRVESVHSCEPHYYEVDRIYDDGVISQPADFRHRNNEITAIYRRETMHFICIWEG